MNEFLEQFLVECRELVDQTTEDLLALDDTPQDATHDTARLDSAFRGFHTLKGGAGIVEFTAMATVLHAAEDVLSAIRTGDRLLSTDLIGDLLACLDQVVQWLDEIAGLDGLPDVADETIEAFIARFTFLQPAAAPTSRAPVSWIAQLLATHSTQGAQARLAIRYTPDPDCFFRGEDPLAILARLPGLLAVQLAPRQPWPTLDQLDPHACNLIITALSTATPEEAEVLFSPVSDQVQIERLGEPKPDGSSALPEDTRSVLEAQLLLAAETTPDGFSGRVAAAARVGAQILYAAGMPIQAETVEQAALAAQQAADPAPFIAAVRAVLYSPAPSPVHKQGLPAQEVAARALRIDVARVDALVKLAGELGVAKNALGHSARLAMQDTDPHVLAHTLKDQHAVLDRLVSELQRAVLGIRVLPLRHVFRRFPRQVREIAKALGKSARLVTEGEATEADKGIVEALFEPMLHVLRNALDHGIEDAATRVGAGKPEIATLCLRAARQGEHVVVELIDDGHGLDLARIRSVAAQRGLASSEALQAMADTEVADLIFAPGFSTATTVTDVSGRGVGMDAVRAAIVKLGGRVELQSQPGAGTCVRFTLPFTMMISRVMTVEAGGQAFGIPLETVVETIRLPRDHIFPVGATHAFVLRDRTIPLIDLARALAPVQQPKPTAQPSISDANIVITSYGNELGALEVDRFGDRLDVMLAPMDGLLAGMRGVAGTTLLGDGRVLIVLDVEDLLQ
jgi:two-component system chemotaxis sensor kinase CheA